MARTRRNTRSSDEALNWVTDHLVSRLHLQTTDPEAAGLRRALWPSSDPLYADTSPVFLTDGFPPSLLKFRSEVMVRDGIIPLKCFFATCPVQVECPRLLVPDELAWVVPRPWQVRAGTYRVRSRHEPLKSLPDRMILAAPLRPAFATDARERSFLDFVERMREKWGHEAFRKMRWLIWMSVRDTSCIDRDDRFMEHLFAILRDFGGQADFVSWDDLSQLQDLRGWGFVEFNRKAVIAESFVKHFVLSKGAVWDEPVEAPVVATPVARVEPLSPYHELVIHSSWPRVTATLQAQDFARMERNLGFDDNIDQRIKERIRATVDALILG